jgi:hypothetical protein
MSVNFVSRVTPALLISTSIGPKAFLVRSAISSTAALSDTSAWMAIASPPFASIVSTSSTAAVSDER